MRNCQMIVANGEETGSPDSCPRTTAQTSASGMRSEPNASDSTMLTAMATTSPMMTGVRATRAPRRAGAADPLVLMRRPARGRGRRHHGATGTGGGR